MQIILNLRNNKMMIGIQQQIIKMSKIKKFKPKKPSKMILNLLINQKQIGEEET